MEIETRKIDPKEITNLLKETSSLFKWNIVLLKTIDSTNTFARNMAQYGAKEGVVVIAENQTNGRGRLGRTWDSADCKGIWMSVILRPSISPQRMLIITQAAAVAIIKSLELTLNIKASIKWPNDIIISNKKLCGILTEMGTEKDLINYAILGIGINVYQQMEDFSDDIKDKAISIKMYQNKDIDINTLISSILYNFEVQYKKVTEGRNDGILNDWNRSSLMTGKRVSVDENGLKINGKVLGISKNGGLIVESDNGILHEVIYGDIFVN